MLHQAYAAPAQARKGNAYCCLNLNPASSDVFDSCAAAIYNAKSNAGERARRFANKAELACIKLAKKNCRKGAGK